MSKRVNLRGKMEEINSKFASKSKSSIANEVLENKVAYSFIYPATSKRK